MTKKKVFPERKYQYQALSFKVEEAVHQPNKSMPTNLAEEKEKFLKSGKTPQFKIPDPSKLAELASKTKNQIRFDLLGEAEFILEKVKEEYGEGEYFLQHMFGVRITKEEATPMLLSYIDENNLTESIKINWCDNMPCSAKMVWTGPGVNANKPELRKYSLWINGSSDNIYMREIGIKCLLDHELGTHFFRMVNDGFQPWFSDRSKFGLRNLGGFEGQCTEEGLASINTALRGRVKLLWNAALAYYTACKAAEMTFKQLFDHIGRYISNPDSRWKAVMRVKRGLTDPNDLGGFGNDQCYFEGAVNILRNLDKIDFNLLMSGKVCFDELDRIKRVARKDVIKVPVFMKNINSYLKTLKKMAALNNLGEVHPHRSPPTAYLRRLDERKFEGAGKKAKKVSSNSKLKGNSPNKGKMKGKHKEKEVEDVDEIESFIGSDKFINDHYHVKLCKEEEQKRMKEDSRVAQMINNLKHQIRTIDLSLEAEISHCNMLVNEHSWSSKESKERLLSRRSSKDSLGQDQRLSPRNAEEHSDGAVGDGGKEENPVVKSSKATQAADVQHWPTFIPNFENEELWGNYQQSNIKVEDQRPSTSGLQRGSSVLHDFMCSGNSHRSLKNICSKSTDLTFPGDGVVSQPRDENLWPDRYSKMTGSVGEMFNKKLINLQMQNGLLSPSVMRLTGQGQHNLGTHVKVNEVKSKLTNIEKVPKIGKGIPMLSGAERFTEINANLSHNICDDCVNNNHDHISRIDKSAGETDLNSSKEVFKSEHHSGFKNAIATMNSVGLLRPQRVRSFKHAQEKSRDSVKRIPLYSDITVAAVKLKATKEGRAQITVTDFKQNWRDEPTHRLIRKRRKSSLRSLDTSIF